MHETRALKGLVVRRLWLRAPTGSTSYRPRLHGAGEPVRGHGDITPSVKQLTLMRHDAPVMCPGEKRRDTQRATGATSRESHDAAHGQVYLSSDTDGQDRSDDRGEREWPLVVVARRSNAQALA